MVLECYGYYADPLSQSCGENGEENFNHQNQVLNKMKTNLTGTKPNSTGRGISRGLTKDKILQVACKLIGEKGLDNFKLHDVAEAFGVKPPAIYNHFSNREAVIVAVADKVSEEMVLAAHLKDTGTAVDKINHFVDGFTKYLYNNPVAAQLQLVDVASRSFLVLGRAAEINEFTRKDIKKIIDQGVSEGSFRPVRPEAFRAFMVAGISAHVVWHQYDKVSKRPSLATLQTEAREFAQRYLERR